MTKYENKPYFTRSLKAPNQSFFLFGPRGTGKSTWLKSSFKAPLYINLHSSKDYLDLVKNPALLRDLIQAADKKWVAIDEIQKLPLLLDEIQEIMGDDSFKVQFILTGSSARKLKKKNSNLLAGRARLRNFFPLTSEELGYDFNVDELLKYGCLPTIHQLSKHQDKVDYLFSYAQTYLNEEIRQEAVVRQLEPFIRFLDVSSLLNGQIWNCSEIARDVGVARTTVEGYLSILLDTLIAEKVEGFRPQAKVKEKSNPKYYYFDSGVVRALSGNLNESLSAYEKGYLLETWILHELRAFSSYKMKMAQFSYWDIPQKAEVDFIVKVGARRFGIEIKYSKEWKTSFNDGLNVLLEKKHIQQGFGVYQGERELKQGAVRIFPLKIFLRKLWNEELF